MKSLKMKPDPSQPAVGSVVFEVAQKMTPSPKYDPVSGSGTLAGPGLQWSPRALTSQRPWRLSKMTRGSNQLVSDGNPIPKSAMNVANEAVSGGSAVPFRSETFRVLLTTCMMCSGPTARYESGGSTAVSGPLERARPAKPGRPIGGLAVIVAWTGGSNGARGATSGDAVPSASSDVR